VPYPQDNGISFTDFETIRVVKIAGLLPTHDEKNYKTRSEWAIRKILIHHHAGQSKSTSEKRADGVPKSCKATADFFIRENNPDKAGTQGRG